MKKYVKVLKVAPTLIVQKVEPTVEFLENHLGFTKFVEVPGDDGLVFAMMVNGAAEIHVQSHASAIKDMPCFSDAQMPAASFVYLDVEDVRALYEQLKSMDIVLPIEKTFYGATHFFIREPGGHILGLSENS